MPIYNSTDIHCSTTVKEYTGSTSRSIKNFLFQHKSSFQRTTRQTKRTKCTELVNYLWKLRDKITQYEIKWKILHHTKTGNNPLCLCTLCNLEQSEIAKADQLRSLNKIKELVTQWRHRLTKFF